MKVKLGLMLLSGALVSSPAIAQTKPAAFGTCAACHSVQKGGRSGIGPNLFGVGNRTAAAVPNFRFSPQMKNSRVVWNRENLIKFIQRPQRVVPGTRMTFGGVSNPASASSIADYLLSLK